MHLPRHRAAVTLARWLGPWSTGVPEHVTRLERTIDTPSGPLLTWVYEPTAIAASGAMLVVPGLHPSGPADVRLDRFCRVLASSGLVVVAPFVRPQLELVVSNGSADDVAAALRELGVLTRTRGLPRPAMMSISFGSLPAITVATRADCVAELGALVLFGAYADFASTMRFALTGRAYDGASELRLPHDPLNVPALFINLLPYLEVPGPRDALHRAWLELARRTWGRPELRPTSRRQPIADGIALDLTPSQRPLFFQGAGLADGGLALLERAIEESAGAFAFADPKAMLARLTLPLLVAHGKDDDVIPWIEARKIERALPHGHRARVALTGLFGHTGATLPNPRAIVGELVNLQRLMYGLVDAPREALG